MLKDNFSERDHYWMTQAIQLAKKAEQLGEVPVGAVLILNDELISEGFNQPISTHDPSAHAEMIALRKAASKIGNYRLLGSTLYVTLEPCMMCTGAMVHARISRLVFGAADPKTGVIASVANYLDSSFLNHRVQYQGGLCAKECGEILSNFFKSRR